LTPFLNRHATVKDTSDERQGGEAIGDSVAAKMDASALANPWIDNRSSSSSIIGVVASMISLMKAAAASDIRRPL